MTYDALPNATPTAKPQAPVQPAVRPAASATQAPKSPRLPSAPPRKNDLPLAWLLLLACLAVVTPTMIFELGKPDITDPLEAEAMSVAIQTYQHKTLSPDGGGVPLLFEGIVPVVNSKRMIDQPPGIVWSHMTMFNVASWFGSPLVLKDMVLWARLASVVMALVAIAAVFWAGYSMGGLATAVFAAMVCAANPVFFYHARVAAPPIHQTAWTLLSIASALWAIRPLRAAPSVARQFIGWTLCGIAMGAAIFMHGPAALLSIVGPTLVVLLLCPDRIGHLMGLVAATLIGVLIVMPWAVHVQEHDPRAWGEVLVSLLPGAWPSWPTYLRQAGSWGLILLLAILPWTVWLIGAVTQPFSASSSGSRLRMFLGWAWFGPLALLLPLVPSDDRRAQLVPVLPALALLIATLFRQVSELAAEGRYVRFWRVLRWPQLVAMTLLSLAVPWAVESGQQLIEWGWTDRYWARGMGWFYSGGMAVTLVGVMVLAWRWAIKQYPGKTLAAWSVWTVLLLALLVLPVVRSDVAQNPMREEAQRLGAQAIVGKTYLLESADATHTAEQTRVDPSVLVYSNLSLPLLPARQLDEMASQLGRLFIVTPAHAQPVNDRMTLLDTYPVSGLKLWRYDRQP